MKESEIREAIATGKTQLGIELGSTKIKAVLIDATFSPVASGSHDWKSTYENGSWTYSLEEVWSGLKDCYRNLAEDVRRQYGVPLTTIGCIGFSAMMHGYLPFDQAGELLTPFRTWQNTSTAQAAAELSELFQFNIPQRWSIAHLEQAILNGEEHVSRLSFLTTLAGYVHWQLTGQKVLGIGDASGMFPIDSDVNDYDARKLEQYAGRNADRGYSWTLRDILPKVLLTGDSAGCLTEAGARALDPTGILRPGIPVCPPEGDAGTGMAATNSVAKRTGNVSAGTSVFSMVVLEKALSAYYPEIDMVTTPAGAPVAMVHCNNCTNDMNAWVGMLGELAAAMGASGGADALYPLLLQEGTGRRTGLRRCAALQLSGRRADYRSGDRPPAVAPFLRQPLYSFQLLPRQSVCHTGHAESGHGHFSAGTCCAGLSHGTRGPVSSGVRRGKVSGRRNKHAGADHENRRRGWALRYGTAGILCRRPPRRRDAGRFSPKARVL